MRFPKVGDDLYRVWDDARGPVGFVKRVAKNLWAARTDDGDIETWDSTRRGASLKLIDQLKEAE